MTLKDLMNVVSYENLCIEVWGNVTAYNLVFGSENDENESYYPTLIDTLWITAKTSSGNYDDLAERKHIVLKRFIQWNLSNTVTYVTSEVTALDNRPLLRIRVMIDDVSAYKEEKAFYDKI